MISKATGRPSVALLFLGCAKYQFGKEIGQIRRLGSALFSVNASPHHVIRVRTLAESGLQALWLSESNSEGFRPKPLIPPIFPRSQKIHLLILP